MSAFPFIKNIFMNNNMTPRSVPVTFRRFSRKSYALFACLGREVRIGVLGAATLSTAAPCLHAQRPVAAPAVAMADSTSEQSLAEATVSASRVPLAAEVGALQVTTLTRDDLAAAGVASLNDVLKLAVGVDVRQRGGFGIQTDISIDGGTFDQMALFVNGVPFSNPQTGHNAADFPFTLEDVDRVEIIEGAATRLFGEQAFSGGINVVTKADGGSLLRLQGGSYGTLVAKGRGAFRLGKRLTTSVSGRYHRSDGAVKNGDFKGGKLFWQGRLDERKFLASWQAGATLNDFGANTFYSGAFPNQWEATRRYFAALRAETKGRLHFVPSLSWVRSTDHFQLVRGTNRGENFNRTDVFTAGLNLWTIWAGGTTSIGAEVRHEHLLSGNLGFDRKEEDWVKIPHQDGRFYNRGANRTNVNFHAEHGFDWRRWKMSLGVLATRNTLEGGGFAFFPGVDVSFRPDSRWRLFASWNSALRQPTFTDLWYKSETHEGNRNLRAEKNSAFRIGADFAVAGVDLSAKAFYQRGRNMIDWVMYDAKDKYHAANFRLNNLGASLSARFDLQRLLGQRQPLERLTVGYAYIHQDRKDVGEVFKSNYAMEYLRHKLVATLTHRVVAHLRASWSLRWQEREGHYLEYADAKSTGRLVPYGAHALLDARLAWETPRYSLTLDATNLTAHRYYDLANVRQPGLLLMAGATWRF